MASACAKAHPNIAFIKYWGDLDPCLRIPANGSLSMNLAGLETRTRVAFDETLASDQLIVNGEVVSGNGLERVSEMLWRVRNMVGIKTYAHVDSNNNFPMGTGIASSASAFAALALAASAAAGLSPSEAELSRLARSGSGSACRSVPSGFVEWQAGETDEESYAHSIAPPEHWEIVDCIVVVSTEAKTVGSTEGHALALTSLLQEARVADAPRRLRLCRQAVCERDFESFTEIVEQDSNLMHAVMITSSPPLLYWQPTTVAIMLAVQNWRKEGLAACYTVDAGPTVHVLCMGKEADEVVRRLRTIGGVQEVLVAKPGGAARLV